MRKKQGFLSFEMNMGIFEKQNDKNNMVFIGFVLFAESVGPIKTVIF